MRAGVLMVVLSAALGVLPGCRIGESRRAARDPAPAEDVVTHVVAAGDTLSKLATHYRVDVETIIAANRIKDPELYLGQQLKIPGGRPMPAKPIMKPVPKPVEQKPDTTWYQPRSAWATASIDRSNIDPMGVKPYRITVHHSEDVSLANGMDEHGDPVQVLRQIERMHMTGGKQREAMACIGYHFLISQDGRVFEGRPLQFQGAHAYKDNNRGNVGICLLGNFDHEAVPAAQRTALVTTLERLRAQFQIPLRPGDRNGATMTILCHKDLKTTECPGRNLEPIVRAYGDGRLKP